MNRKHDQTYNNAFSNRRAVADLVGSHAAPDLADRLDFSTLAPLPASHVDSRMSSRRGDLLWKVRFRDSSAVLLVVIKFQSGPDPQMAIRIQDYVVLALRYALKNKLSGPGGGPPPVLPVVVYNGKRAWTSPRSLGEMTAPVPGLPPPGEYVLVDMLRQGRDAVAWMASQKFGLETGARLELKTSLAELADVAEIVRVVQAVMESGTQDEMLDRVREICRA